MSGKHWLYTVSAAVVAGIVLDVITGADVLAWLWGVTLAALGLALPLWAVFLSFIVCFLLAAFVGSVAARTMREVKKPEPLWKKYTKDKIFGVQWRWSVHGLGEIGSPSLYCPKCDMQLSILSWNCTNCDFQDHPSKHFTAVPNSIPVKTSDPLTLAQRERDRLRKHITGRVKNEVERRMRTGEYKEAL